MVSGSWGGQGGEQWTYQPKGEICKIFITYEDAIHSICFTSQGENSILERSDQFGGEEGNQNFEIDIDIKIEKLNGISGTVGTYNGLQIITSLCFTTDSNNSYGPFGSVRGASFSLLGDAQAIIGFHGRSSRWLNAIGVNLQPIARLTSAGPLQSISKLISAGPWGSQEPGNKWIYVPKGSISHISITHDDAIRTIRFTSKDENNNVDHSKRFGKRTGSKIDEISIDIKNEKINNISGTFDLESGYDVITSLSFSTNKETIFGPFGTARGTAFSLMVNDHSFIGFHGRSSDWLDAIGVYLQPRTKIRVRQWGCQQLGNDWSYSPRGAISNMTITHDEVINTISFTSRDDKGNVHHSGNFGWTTGCNSDEINIDTKYEKLNNISGTFGLKIGYVVITSLSFSTDKNTLFGPFGSARGAAFSLPVKNGYLSGFYGRSGYWLDAIGVYVNPM